MKKPGDEFREKTGHTVEECMRDMVLWRRYHAELFAEAARVQRAEKDAKNAERAAAMSEQIKQRVEATRAKGLVRAGQDD